MHYSEPVVETAKMFKLKLLFNASYKSELNPIERLWAFSKRIFGRELLELGNRFSYAETEALVRRSIALVDPASLVQRIRTCLRMGKAEL